MDHVGWTRLHTALYYLQLAKVFNPAGASARLSATDVPTVTSEWHDVNDLRRFVCAFPSDAPQKRFTSGIMFFLGCSVFIINVWSRFGVRIGIEDWRFKSHFRALLFWCGIVVRVL